MHAMIGQFLRHSGVVVWGVVASLWLAGCGNDKGATSKGSAGSSMTGGGGDKPMAGDDKAGSSPDVSGDAGKSGEPTPIGGGTSTAAEIATKLGRSKNFLIGLGNDAPKDNNWEHAGGYMLGSQLDLHYIYLVFGWENWNPGGLFAKLVGQVDVGKHTTPMSTVWAIAGNGENNFDTLVNDTYMTQYWDAAKLLMQRYAELDTPALVHVEPDFWAYAQQKSHGDPSTVPAHLAPTCSNLPADVSGMARCWIKLARDLAPKVVIGLHASEWGGEDVGGFLNKLGVAEADLVVIDILDRDAGCFEDGKLAQCMRGGTYYLDETNKTSPNYAERLAFAKDVSTTTGKPILWWQLPLGVPSDKPGGTSGHFRDNKVHYLFSHVQDFVDAGGLGATFGTGAADQTDVTTDGGQFGDALKAYDAKPVPLP